MNLKTAKQTAHTSDRQLVRNHHLRRLVLLMASMLVVVAVALVVTPAAEAQEPSTGQSEQELRFQRPQIAERCNDGETSYPAGHLWRLGGEESVYCVEYGFTTITNEPLCSAATEATNRGIWFPDHGICVDSISGSNSGRPCPAPLFPFEREQHGAGGFIYVYEGCYLPMMSNVNSLAKNVQQPASPTPICIENSIVQNADGDSSLVVGSTFRGVDGTLYVVTTGGDCTFGCVDGFDANCDGKLGDYCAAELDRHKASDVATCLIGRSTGPA